MLKVDGQTSDDGVFVFVDQVKMIEKRLLMISYNRAGKTNKQLSPWHHTSRHVVTGHHHDTRTAFPALLQVTVIYSSRLFVIKLTCLYFCSIYCKHFLLQPGRKSFFFISNCFKFSHRFHIDNENFSVCLPQPRAMRKVRPWSCRWSSRTSWICITTRWGLPRLTVIIMQSIRDQKEFFEFLKYFSLGERKNELTKNIRTYYH